MRRVKYKADHIIQNWSSWAACRVSVGSSYFPQHHRFFEFEEWEIWHRRVCDLQTKHLHHFKFSNMPDAREVVHGSVEPGDRLCMQMFPLRTAGTKGAPRPRNKSSKIWKCFAVQRRFLVQLFKNLPEGEFEAMKKTVLKHQKVECMYEQCSSTRRQLIIHGLRSSRKHGSLVCNDLCT